MKLFLLLTGLPSLPIPAVKVQLPFQYLVHWDLGPTQVLLWNNHREELG